MLEVSGIDVFHGASQALFGMSFTVGEGEVVTLMGRNGMGKTTLFRIITQNQSADSGQVILRKGAQAATLEQELDDFGGSVLERVV
ncbi:MAG: ATP-binding cassette domain-containing protein, partial [Alphaproteobacteria bacterium]|nr:ATP-binding cassette domain-containing protein [Alphaproteobacteria bacterium]